MEHFQLAAQPLSESEPDLGRIHRTALSDTAEIIALLREAQDMGVVFQGGLGRDLDREQAFIETVHADYASFSTRNFDMRERERVALTFRLLVLALSCRSFE